MYACSSPSGTEELYSADTGELRLLCLKQAPESSFGGVQIADGVRKTVPDGRTSIGKSPAVSPSIQSLPFSSLPFVPSLLFQHVSLFPLIKMFMQNASKASWHGYVCPYVDHVDTRPNLRKDPSAIAQLIEQ